jgi:hypothetical protein
MVITRTHTLILPEITQVITKFFNSPPKVLLLLCLARSTSRARRLMLAGQNRWHVGCGAMGGGGCTLTDLHGRARTGTDGGEDERESRNGKGRLEGGDLRAEAGADGAISESLRRLIRSRDHETTGRRRRGGGGCEDLRLSLPIPNRDYALGRFMSRNFPKFQPQWPHDDSRSEPDKALRRLCRR